MRNISKALKQIEGVKQVPCVTISHKLGTIEIDVVGGDKQAIAKIINDWRTPGYMTIGNHKEIIKTGGIIFSVRFNYCEK